MDVIEFRTCFSSKRIEPRNLGFSHSICWLKNLISPSTCHKPGGPHFQTPFSTFPHMPYKQLHSVIITWNNKKNHGKPSTFDGFPWVSVVGFPWFSRLVVPSFGSSSRSTRSRWPPSCPGARIAAPFEPWAAPGWRVRPVACWGRLRR